MKASKNLTLFAQIVISGLTGAALVLLAAICQIDSVEWNFLNF